MSWTEHTTRVVAAKDLTYWLSTLEHDGWQVELKELREPDRWLLLGRRDEQHRREAGHERPQSHLLAGRVGDECRYARNREELINGLEQLLTGAERHEDEAWLELESERVRLLVSSRYDYGKPEHALELDADPSRWPRERLIELMEAAGNVLVGFKVPASAVAQALTLELAEAVAQLKQVLCTRAEVSIASGREGQGISIEASFSSRPMKLRKLSTGGYQLDSGRRVDPTDVIADWFSWCVDDRADAVTRNA